MVNSLTELVAAGGISATIGSQSSQLASLLTAASSGQRIVRALDDIAALSVATSLATQTSGLRAASLNISQASSFLSVADGGIAQIGNILGRLSQLSAQANSGALSDVARSGLNAEFQDLVAEVNRLAGNTRFNGVSLLDGSLAADSTLAFSDDIAEGNVDVTGSIDDSLITSGLGQAARQSLSFADASQIAVGNSISIDDGNGGQVNFTFVNGAPTNANEIEIGSSLEQTLENAARTLNTYTGADDFGIAQLEFSIDGNSLVIQNARDGNALAADGTTPIGIASTTAGTLSGASLNNGSAGGIDASGITNAAFTGRISGFDATFVGNDRVNLSLSVGGSTYRANGVSTDNASDTTVTFTSEEGDSFDITFAAGQGESVRSGAEADAFAARLDAAFSGVRFTQERTASNVTASGALAGASLIASRSNFSAAEIDGISLANSTLEIELSGETFRSGNLGDSIGAGERVTLTAANGESLTFVNGETRFDISTSSGENAFLASLQNALPNQGGGAAFQVSADASGSLQIGIGNFSAAGLGLDSLNLLSADSAATAFAAVGAAINTLTSQRADVGAFQQALDFAAGNIDVALQNQEAARAFLLDTDIAENSTETSLLEAARQAAISSLAQTNRLQSNLLQLIQ